ncbi:MAG: ABC transporter permease [Planctomycetes bacterium]|nr:ABC transporter permease [Planctomycetota bacterium]
MGTLWQDMRYGLRMLVKNPGFTLAVVLILTLGIGANTAIFSIVNAVLLRPLPFRDPDHIVQLSTYLPKDGDTLFSNTLSDFAEIRKRNRVFDQFVAVRAAWFVDIGGDEPRSVRGARVPAEFFPMLGVLPMLGRSFYPEEEQPGKDQVVVLSHAYWNQRYGADPNIVGHTITFKEGAYTVVGVMPPTFRFPGYEVVWKPLALTAEEAQSRFNYFNAKIFGHLKSGVTLEQAEAELNVISSQLSEAHERRSQREFRLTVLRERLVADVRSSLWMLFGTLGFVLLIACTNVANMLLARSAGREREIAVRAALGAGRLRLVRQCVTESLMLSIAGGLGALLLAFSLLEVMRVFLPSDMPRVSEIRIDGWVFVFTLTVSLVMGTLIGLAPTLRFAEMAMGQTLREGRLSLGGGRRRYTLHKALLVCQVALSLMLLAGAGLMIKSLRRLTTVDLGFDPKGVLCVEVDERESIYEQPEPYFRALMERVPTFPGVRMAAIGSLPLLGSSVGNTFDIAGRDVSVDGEEPTADFTTVSKDYFATLRIPVLAGSVFSEQDYGDGRYVALINQTLARRYFPEGSPVGQILICGGKSLHIVGVVGDVRPKGFRSDVMPTVYSPYLYSGWGSSGTYLMVRAHGAPQTLFAMIRQELLRLSPRRPVSNIRTIEEMLADGIAPMRFNTELLGLFAALALILAAFGVYGLMAFSVSQRTQEIGIRMALGAKSSDVLKGVLRQGLKLTCIGIALGLAISLAITQMIHSFLYDVSPNDPLTFACVSVLLAGVAMLASYIPARRAAKIDPMVALRYE